jgi:hypothetical protein
MGKYNYVLLICCISLILALMLGGCGDNVKSISTSKPTEQAQATPTDEPATKVEQTVTPRPTPNFRKELPVLATVKDLIPRYEGYWHSAPDYSNGILEFYTFSWTEYIGGYYMKNDRNKNHQFDASECRIDRNNDILYFASWFAEYPNYTIQYIAEDSATNGPALIINDKKFWKLDRSDSKQGDSTLSGGAGSAIPKEGMENLESIKGSYSKGNEGKQGKLEILGASPIGIKFEIQIEDNVKLQGSAEFVEGTDRKNATDYFKKAIYENGRIVFEKLDNGNIKIRYPDKPDYTGEWLKK